MAYTNDEKEAAVLRIIQGKPGFRRSSLATRRVDSTYEEVSELVKTALFYEPDSIYYLIYLSSNFYTRKLNTAIKVVDDVLDAIDDLLVKNRPIEDVSSIDDARRALQDMSSALSRNGVVSSQAFSRYRSSMARSKEALGRAVKLSRVPRGGSQTVTDVVKPRDEARTLISGELPIMRQLQADILEAVDLLLAAESSYSAVGIATAVAANQVQRASTDLEDLSNMLTPMTPKQRVSQARSGLLRVLSNLGSVKAMAEVPYPGAPKLEASAISPAYRINAYGSGTAPAIIGTEAAPWRIENGAADILKVSFGGTPVTVDLLPGTGYNSGIRAPEILGSKHENFRIAEDLDIPHALLSRPIATGTDYTISGTTLYLIVDGVTYEVGFSSDLSATEVRDRINTVAGAVVNATAVINSGGNDWVVVAYDNSSPPYTPYRSRYMRIATGENNADSLGSGGTPWRVGVPGGPYDGYVTRGWDDTTELWVQPNDDSMHTVVDLIVGVWPNYYRTADQIVTDIDDDGGAKFSARADEGRVVIFSERKGNGGVVVVKSQGLDGAGRGYPSYSAMLELGFTEDQDAREEDIPIQTVLGVLNRNPDFNAVATASADQQIILKALSATVISADELTVELLDVETNPLSGWDLSQVKAFISSGDNSGIYGIDGVSWSAPDLVLTLDRNLRDQTTTNRHLVSITSDRLAITSKDASVLASIDVDQTVGNSAHTVLGLPTAAVIGTVSSVLVERNDSVLGWVPADISRLKLRVGDKIVDLDSAEVAIIAGIDQTSVGILDVEPVASDFTLTSGFTVVSASSLLHDDFHYNLETWRNELSPFDDDSLSRIDTVLGPILILDEPSRDQVNSAYSVVNAYRDKLSALDTILRGFSVARVASVDTAMRTMLQHGHDRARELLLQSNFGDFADTTARTASFSRALMNQASAVAVEDINEPTTTRGEDETEFDRFRAGWIEDEDPGLEVENEEEISDTPVENYWPDDYR